ncbi:MAG: hypothetical protein AAFQ27_05885 [Pseudomonadota bacterium]
MRCTRIAVAALLPFAVLACAEEEVPEAEELAEETEAKSDFAKEAPPPPPASWGEENFSDDNDGSDSSFSDEQAGSAEDLR